jgi:hypothetical protein
MDRSAFRYYFRAKHYLIPLLVAFMSFTLMVRAGAEPKSVKKVTLKEKTTINIAGENDIAIPTVLEAVKKNELDQITKNPTKKFRTSMKRQADLPQGVERTYPRSSRFGETYNPYDVTNYAEKIEIAANKYKVNIHKTYPNVKDTVIEIQDGYAPQIDISADGNYVFARLTPEDYRSGRRIFVGYNNDGKELLRKNIMEQDDYFRSNNGRYVGFVIIKNINANEDHLYLEWHDLETGATWEKYLSKNIYADDRWNWEDSYELKISDLGDVLVRGSISRRCVYYDSAGNVLFDNPTFQFKENGVYLSRDGNRIILWDSSTDKDIYLFGKSGELIKKITSDAIQSFDISPDNNLFLITSRKNGGKKLRLFNMAGEKVLEDDSILSPMIFFGDAKTMIGLEGNNMEIIKVNVDNK